MPSESLYKPGSFLRTLQQSASKFGSNNANQEPCKRQGINARKVISEVYAFFVLQCTLIYEKFKVTTHIIKHSASRFYNLLLLFTQTRIEVRKYYTNQYT